MLIPVENKVTGKFLCCTSEGLHLQGGMNRTGDQKSTNKVFHLRRVMLILKVRDLVGGCHTIFFHGRHL